jgi:hypothetical protein
MKGAADVAITIRPYSWHEILTSLYRIEARICELTHEHGKKFQGMYLELFSDNPTAVTSAAAINRWSNSLRRLYSRTGLLGTAMSS